MASKLYSDAVYHYMAEVTSRVVAKSGIPSDRYHLGKIILQCLKEDPNAVMQIDGATGECDTNASMLEKTVKCATSFRKIGLNIGDVMVLMAPNHLDLSVPFYAALCTGIVVSAIDRTLGIKELRDSFSISEPKIIFCQSEKAPDVQIALNEINLNATIVTFDKGDYLCSFSEFMDKYADDTTVEDFRPTDFDPEVTASFLISTSGTTGVPKAAEVTHKNFTLSVPMFWVRCTKFPRPTQMSFVAAPLQWLTSLFNFLSAPIFQYTKLQSSLPLTQEHAYYLINTYKPTYTIFSPTLMLSLIKGSSENRCDFSCLELILIGGSAVPASLLEDIKRVSPNTHALNAYGMSELAGIAFLGDPSTVSSGKPLGCFEYRIVNIDTQEDIEEANVPGELWLKGPTVFKGYYKNKEATEETFADDGWFKTGDMFYRDENWNFFFTERIKLLLKYRNYQISPVEVENVIRQHPAVLDVAVTGVPDPEYGDLPVACVVVRDGHTVSPDEIKDLVKESLADSKQLRGGVIFLDSIPMTASTKVHRRKLKELVLDMERL